MGRKRERGREGERERGREGEGERGRGGERREGERERGREGERERGREGERERGREGEKGKEEVSTFVDNTQGVEASNFVGGHQSSSLRIVVIGRARNNTKERGGGKEG